MITPPPQRSKRGMKLVIGLIVTIVVILTVMSLAVIGFGLSIRSFRVTGVSMEPGLHNGQVVYVSLLSYTFSSPSRGDLIVFHEPLSLGNTCQLLSLPGAFFLNRIIGIPGDTVSVTSTAVMLNGRILSEPYIAPASNGTSQNGMTTPGMTLEPGQYFLLGDNRLSSADSRCYGPVPFQDFVGKVLIP